MFEKAIKKKLSQNYKNFCSQQNVCTISTFNKSKRHHCGFDLSD